jgi:RNA polymerase sigma-70 factor, ECF subfamily
MSPATMTMPTPTPAEPAAAAEDWPRRLEAGAPRREEAIGELHALLLRAARFEIGRRRAQLPHLRGDDWDDLAHQSADDALVALLGKLEQFRGESRFTTWAYKFALLEASVKVRRRAWQGREIPVEEEAWAALAGRDRTGRSVERMELLAALREEIEGSLSPRQREVLVAVALNDVPIDVLAERLQSTRGALYKTLHDARRKLRAALGARGFDTERLGEEEA